MNDDNHILHALLLRQLKRNAIELSDIRPEKRAQWGSFVLSVSRAYTNYEQDLYLLERSMTISSKELMALNEKHESAQKIAHFGYWRHDRETGQLSWSKEMFQLTGFDPAQGVPDLNDVLNQIQEDDRLKIMGLMQQSFADGSEFNIEVQFKNKQTGEYYWHYCKGHPENADTNHSSAEPIRFLTGIVIDITERKKNELDLAKSHRQLLSISRQAGMAEVATSILHNLGNMLNSANVSMALVKESLSQPYYEKWFKIIKLIKTQHQTLGDYFTQDKTGKLIPDYLVELADIIAENHKRKTAEIEHLNEILCHINGIVAMQKSISGTSGVVEETAIPEIIDTALNITSVSEKNQGIMITKKLDDVPPIYTDKSKLLQIIINLIRNAKAAVSDNPKGKGRNIDIVIKKTSKKIRIRVIDNGIGIKPENITLIFSFGFTTKKDGHGFGLHRSALSAKELGGALQAESHGENYGATFTLTLPTCMKNRGGDIG